MALSKPSSFSASNSDGCIFLSWSPVTNATEYGIELKTHDTGAETIYCTTSTNFLITKLENGRLYGVHVIALNKTERSEPSLGIMVRPKLRQSLSKLSATLAEQPGRIRLQWTGTPTDFGFQVERCNVGDVGGYKRIGWFPYNTITTYDDQTGCDLSKGVCSGHYYTVTFRDTAWSCGAGVLSRKVFCLSPINSNFVTESEKADLFETNPSETSATVPIVASESGLISSEQSSIETVKQDDSTHDNSSLEHTVLSS